LKISALLLLVMMMLVSCNDQVIPKPKAYPRIIFPEKSFETFEATYCPFKMQMPTYSTVERDSTFFNQKTEHPCWVNVKFGQFKGTIHMNYKPIDGMASFEKLLEDAHKLTYKHSYKAKFIDDELFQTETGATAMVYSVGGNAASNVQFFVTDQQKHYVRGALYFETVPNIDSILPVVNFVKQDMVHLINTLEWTDEL